MKGVIIPMDITTRREDLDRITIQLREMYPGVRIALFAGALEAVVFDFDPDAVVDTYGMDGAS